MNIEVKKPALVVKKNVRIYEATGLLIVKEFSSKAKEAFEKETFNLELLRKVIPSDSHKYFCFNIPQIDEHHTLRRRIVFPKYDMDLRTYILSPSNKPLNLQKMNSDISTALTLLHHYGFVHNDVKPENILVDVKNNRFVLADFGLTMRKNTIPNGIIGTPRYISPRMLLNKSAVSSENDWWSYACVLVNVLTVYCLDTPEEPVLGYSIDFEPDEETEMSCKHRDYLQLFKGTSDIHSLFVTPAIADDLCNALQILSTQTASMKTAFIEEITNRLFINRKADAPKCKDFTSCILENFQPNDLSGHWNPNAPEWATHSNKWTLSANRYKDPVVQLLLRKALTIFLWFAKDTQCRKLFSIRGV